MGTGSGWREKARRRDERDWQQDRRLGDQRFSGKARPTWIVAIVIAALLALYKVLAD